MKMLRSKPYQHLQVHETKRKVKPSGGGSCTQLQNTAGTQLALTNFRDRLKGKLRVLCPTEKFGASKVCPLGAPSRESGALRMPASQ